MKNILLAMLLYLSVTSAAQKPALTKGNYEETPVKTTIKKHPNTPVPQDSPELQYFDFEVIAKDKVKITKCHLDWQEVEIPASVVSNGHKFIVVELAANLFRNNHTLQKITIPNTIVRIGDHAFYGCNPHVYFLGNISDWCAIDFADWNSNPISKEKEFYINNCPFDVDLRIPNGTKKIGNYAFRNLEKLRSVTIPNSVTTIGEMAFRYCLSLTSINVSANNSNYSSVDGVLFNKDKTMLITCPEGKSGIYTIPNSVTSIGYCALIDCSKLTSVTIPNSVTNIGEQAFSGCSSLTSVHIADIEAWCKITFANAGANPLFAQVSREDENLYRNGEILTDLVIPNSGTSIGNYAFIDYSKLTSVTIPNNVTHIGVSAFYRCSSLASVTIGNNVTSIGEAAFSGCSSLTSLTIPSSVTTVGNNTFNSLPALQSVVLYSAPKNMVFFQCPVLTHITWNVKSEVDSQKLFDRIKNQILSFTIGEDVEYIPANICNGMINLESIVIPTNIKQIGSHAFANCNKLTLVTWNATNSKIDDAIFQNTASKIKCFNFGESVNIIPDFLCDGMSNLTSITIPKDVKVIGKNVFRYCRNLTSVIWNAENCEPTMWGEYQNDWYKNKELENDYIIFGSGKQDWYMYGPFANISHKITSFKIGENVQQIPSYLCFGMSKAKITFHKDIQTIGEYALSEVYKVQFQGKVTQCANVFYNNKKWYDTIIYIPQEYLKYYKSLRTAMGLKKAKVIYKTF